MVSSHGYRRQTRKLFKKAFKTRGMPSLSTYMQKYNVGDLVDIKVNSAIQKGMPHKFYHGKTGVIAEINKSSVIVKFSRTFANKSVERRVITGIEHIKKSSCQKEYLERKEKNQKIIEEAAKKNIAPVLIKRVQKGPKPAVYANMENIVELKHIKV